MNFRLYIAKLLFGLYLIFRTIIYYSKRYLLGLSLTFVLLLGILIKIILFPTYTAPNLNQLSQKTIFISRGATLREIAGILENEGILQNKSLFILLGKISGYQNQIKAGLFEVPEHLHPWHLLIYLTKPKPADIKVTLPEGILLEEMAHILSVKIGIDSSKFMQLAFDSSFCQELSVDEKNLEGYLLPETYFFTYGMKEKDIIRLLVRNTLEIFSPDSVRIQMAYLGMNIHELITLASIIEGEVIVDSERVLVSSVYHNRLKRGWLLGADPTIQYVIPGPPKRLLEKDLEIDSPYNTYKHRGLPPGPINNPGKLSILAAIFPAKTRYMYFVATGDGGHHFSRTASQHAYWKARFNKVRREVRRQRRFR